VPTGQPLRKPSFSRSKQPPKAERTKIVPSLPKPLTKSPRYRTVPSARIVKDRRVPTGPLGSIHSPTNRTNPSFSDLFAVTPFPFHSLSSLTKTNDTERYRTKTSHFIGIQPPLNHLPSDPVSIKQIQAKRTEANSG
jgi:hypothetical protein